MGGHGIEGAPGETVEQRTHQQHGGRAVLHHAVVTHGRRLVGNGDEVNGARDGEGALDTRYHAIGKQSLAADGRHGLVAGPQRPVLGVHERCPGFNAAGLVGDRPRGHRGGEHGAHGGGHAMRVRGHECHLAAVEQCRRRIGIGCPPLHEHRTDD